LGKILTTRVRRLISSFNRSKPFVVRIRGRCAKGNAKQARQSSIASSSSLASAGCEDPQRTATVSAVARACSRVVAAKTSLRSAVSSLRRQGNPDLPGHANGESRVESTDELRFAWYHRVVPLLQEYFYNDGERLKAVLGARFVSEQKPDAKLFDAPPESFDADMPRYDIRRFDGDDQGFLNALRALAGMPTNATEPLSEEDQ